MKRIFTLLLTGFIFYSTSAQQNVFNRSDANTGDWGSGNLPWFYQLSNNNQGNPDNNNTVRNDVFIGHNSFTTMSLNGRFYIHRDFTFQAGASTQRILNNTAGGGFSFSRNLINQANVTHIFNAPVGIDGNNAVIQLENSGGGGLTFNGSVFTNGNQTFIRFINGNTGTITFNGPMTQAGSFVKQNGGTLVFTGSADFSGSIFIDEGTVRIGRNLSSNSIEIGGGVQLSTGFNATLEISNGGTNVSKNITVRNFGTGSGNRFITFSHPSSTTATISGTVSLEKEVTITNPNTNDGAIISGIISNTGGLVKSGTGILELTAQNTYTGLTTVSQGTLRLNRTGGSTLPSANNITVASGATVRVSTNQTIQDLNLSAGGNLTIDAGATLTITGTYTPGNGTINCLGTIILQGSAAQTFPGANTIINNGTADQLTNLTISNSNGVSLNKAFTVAGTLTLTSGNLNLNSNNLTVNGSVAFTSGYIITGVVNNVILGPIATTSGASSTSHINGNAVKTFAASTVNPSFAFPVGNGTSTTYAPVTFTGTGTTGAQGTLRVSTTAGSLITPAASGISNTNRLGRFWTATNTGITNITSYAASFTYPSGEAAGTPASYIARYTNGTNWNNTTISSPTSTSASITGISTNSIITSGVTNQFVIGNAANVSLPTVTIASNNLNSSSRARVGDAVTLTFTSSEGIGTPTVTIAGSAATVTGGPTVWTASRTMTGSDADGIVAFNIAFSDLAGNAGTAVTATTNASSVTFDKIVPTLSTVTIASNNVNSSSRAKVGDAVTLTFTSSESIGTPTVTIAGSSATVTGGPTVWTASRTMTGSDADGIVAFNIAFSDLAANAGTAVTATTNASSVTFDKIVPTLSTVTIASNNVNSSSRAKVGDAVTLTFTSSESIGTPTVTIAGSAATVTGGPTVWTASRTMTGSDADGIVAFNIAFSDLAANAGTAVTATTNASSVTFDKIVPTLSTVTIASNNVNSSSRAKVGDAVTLTFTSSESIGTPTVTIAGSSATVTGGPTVWTASRTMTGSDADGIVAFNIAFSDLAANAGTAVTATTNASSVTFDKTAPVISPVTIASNNPNNQQAQPGNVITLSFTTSETAASTPSVTINGGGNGTVTVTNVGGNNWTATKTVTECSNQVVTFSITLSDLAGNNATQTSTTNGSTVTVLANTFTGAVNSNWNNAGNWTCGVPASNFTETINIADGANVTLDVNLTIGSGGSLNLLGTTGSFTINPGITLTINPGTANFNGRPVIVKSDATGTASLGIIGNNGSNLSGATNVTVERYLGTVAKRAWRLVTAPVRGATNNSVFFNWQNNGTISGATGIEIWGPGGTGSGGNGLAVGPGNSMRAFENGAFVDVTNTKTTELFPASGNQKGFFLFVAGAYGSNNIIQSSPTSPFSPATVNAKGALITGNYSYQTSGQTGNANRSYFIGNPYAAPVDPNSITGTNLQNTFYMWDPALQGLFNVGGYVAYDRLNNTYNVGANPGTSYSNAPVTAIQSGQAFIARADAAGDITVNFTESMKSGNSTNATSRTSSAPSEQVRVILQRNFAGSTYLTSDGVVAFYYDNASSAINGMDGRKLLNSFDNLMMVRNSTNLTFEHRPLITAADTIFLSLSNTSQANYRFEISTENFRPAFGYKPYLQDLYLSTETLLPLNGSAGVNFAVDANAASTGNRFRIVFRADVATSVRDNDAARWIKIYPNPAAAGSPLQIEFKNRNAGKYIFVLYNAAGMQVLNSQLIHAGGTAISKVDVPATLSQGIYIAEITDEKGNRQELKITIQ